jgi:hypothetical protein
MRRAPKLPFASQHAGMMDCYALRSYNPSPRSHHHSYQDQRPRSRFIASGTRRRKSRRYDRVRSEWHIFLTNGELLVDKSVTIRGVFYG